MLQGREVPANRAEEFLKDIDKDPKFVRFQERLGCVDQIKRVREGAEAALAELHEQKRELSVPDPRALALGLLLSVPLLSLAAALPWWQARLAELGLVVVALFADEVRSRRAEVVRQARVREVEGAIESVSSGAVEAIGELEARIVEIDQVAAASIRIIDPDTFGKQPEKKNGKPPQLAAASDKQEENRSP